MVDIPSDQLEVLLEKVKRNPYDCLGCLSHQRVDFSRGRYIYACSLLSAGLPCRYLVDLDKIPKSVRLTVSRCSCPNPVYLANAIKATYCFDGTVIKVKICGSCGGWF